VVNVTGNLIQLDIKPELATLLGRLQAFLARQNARSYVVGGLPRDLMLGRDPADIDLAVEADVKKLMGAAEAELGMHAVLLDAENGVVRLLPQGDTGACLQVDLSTLAGSLDADLARRDFTINAMALPLAELAGAGGQAVTLIDPFGGAADLAQKKLRAVSDGIFAADPIRLMRAVRLSAELGFAPTASTEAVIMRDSMLISRAAGERVREELLSLLRLSGSDEHLEYMHKTGLLPALIPELEASVDLVQPSEHAWDVFHHSLKSIAALDFILRRGHWPYAGMSVLDDIPWSERLEAYFASPVSHGSTRREIIKLAALLHDIAKPQTCTLTASGRIRFYGHPQQGAPLAAGVMRRLRFSLREVRLVEIIVGQHLRPVQLGSEDRPTPRAAYRYYRDLEEAAVDTLYFSLADHLAARGPELDLTNWRWHANMVAYLLAAGETRQDVVAPVKLVDGHDLLRMGLKPGPEIGELIETIREAQAAGEVTSRRDALELANTLIRQGKDEKTI
jgi:poly(A) polymerase